MLATMLLFQYDGHGDAAGAVVLRRRDRVVLSAPLVLLDWGIVAFLLGLVVWCAEKAEELFVGGFTGVEAVAGVEREGAGEWVEGMVGGKGR